MLSPANYFVTTNKFHHQGGHYVWNSTPSSTRFPQLTLAYFSAASAISFGTHWCLPLVTENKRLFDKLHNKLKVIHLHRKDEHRISLSWTRKSSITTKLTQFTRDSLQGSAGDTSVIIGKHVLVSFSTARIQ